MTLFAGCFIAGAVVLATQLFLGLTGGDADHDGGATIEEGLDLFGVRQLSAGVAFFGLSGLWGISLGLPAAVAAAAALLPGALALLGTSLAMRALLRLQSNGSLELEGAVGEAATVYLRIPGGRSAPGKVLLTLQGRTVELQAVTPGDAGLPTGASVIVVSVVDPDTVEVVPTSIVEEVL